MPLRRWSCKPYPSYLRRFNDALKSVQEDDGKGAGSLNLMRQLADEVLTYGGDFAPIGTVVSHLEDAKKELVRSNINKVLKRVGITPQP